MDVGGDVADLMVKEGIQLTEASIKLLAAGSKNLIAFLLALARDNKKVMGKTQLGRLLKEGKELKPFRVKESDLKDFAKRAKQYGILYTAVKDKRGTGIIDLITTKLGTRTYTVAEVFKVSETDNSMLSDTSDNCITLFTCVRDQSAYRWCVRAIET